MDALEKLKRLTKPQCIEDYGLSVSLSELMESGEEGQAWVQGFFVNYVPFNKWPDSIKKEANKFCLEPKRLEDNQCQT